MKPISCEKAYYVKLGRNGSWEESSLKKNIMRIGWPNQSLADINASRWEVIQEQLQADHTQGVATRDRRALQMLCESTPKDIWITFNNNHLWWCRVSEQRIYEDKISKYRKVDMWRNQDISGAPLLTTQIPGRISKLQGFRGTICKVREVEELTRLINRQCSTEFEAIRHARTDLCRHVEAGLRRLHWKDFETLVDLIFRATGWRRVSLLGETMKFLDLELEEPINGDLYQVQVKSSATFNDFMEYSKAFQGNNYRKMFFVVHTPDKKLSDISVAEDSQVQVVLPGRLSKMVVDLGLLGWLLNKIR